MAKTAGGDGERTTKLARRQTSRPTLTVLSEGGTRSLSLEDDRSIIGRGEGADVVIDDGSLSRKHAAIELGDLVTVEDLGSSNGTRVRGRALSAGERVVVGWGEPIELGEVVVIVRKAEGGADVAAGPTGSPMQEVERMLALVAPTDISVLLLGETGVGKGYLASQIHARSTRSTGPWLHLNCAALPEALLESELFGHERGAFSGALQTKQGLLESATGGTVFLDEIGDMPPAIQAKLLLALERREVLRVGALKPRPIDVRLISATNKAIEGGDAAFRADLFYRLAGVSITVPPLRDRTGEIPALAARFLTESAARLGRPEPALTSAAARALEAYAWPGNVRELAAVILRAIVLSKGALDAEHLMLPVPRSNSEPPPPPSSRPAMKAPAAPSSARTLGEEVSEIERRRITDALEATAGNQSRAAELLGISRRTLISRMIDYGLPRPRKQ